MDTNCLIDIEDNRAGAVSVRRLADAHAAGTAEVALVAIAASEKPRPGNAAIENFAEFEERLSGLHLDHLTIIEPMAYWDIAFWDHGFWADDDAIALEKAIHDILFPESPFNVEDVGSEPRALAAWRNKKCDVQSYWAHLHQNRDVFVTGDREFHKETKKPRLLALGQHCARILQPDEAAALLG